LKNIKSKSIQVTLNRIRRNPKQMQNARSDSEDADNFKEEGDESEVSSWSGRLRS